MKIQARDVLQRADDEADRVIADAQDAAERALSEATSGSAEKLATSRREAETLVASAINEAKSLRARVKAETEVLRTTRRAQTDEFATVAENEAQELRAKAKAEAATTTSRARAEAEEIVKRAKADAADRITAAQTQSGKILDSARTRAEEIVRDARQERGDLDRRIDQLQIAVTDIERELQKLSATALERAGLVSGMIELERTPIGAIVPRDFAPGPAASVAVKERHKETAAVGGRGLAEALGKTIDVVDAPTLTPAQPAKQAFAAPARPELKPRHHVPDVAELQAKRSDIFADPDGLGMPPAARPVIEPVGAAVEGVVEAPVEVADEMTESDGEDAGQTIYQRRGGGLRRRLEGTRSQHPER